jgi:prevent-host-death family protein
MCSETVPNCPTLPAYGAPLAANHLGDMGQIGACGWSAYSLVQPSLTVSTLWRSIVYTWSMEVGIRELRGSLSDYLARVREGNEVVVTDRGTAFARIVPIKGGRTLDRVIAEGLVTPAPQPSRTRPARRVKSRGGVSDLVGEQRR